MRKELKYYEGTNSGARVGIHAYSLAHAKFLLDKKLKDQFGRSDLKELREQNNFRTGVSPSREAGKVRVIA